MYTQSSPPCDDSQPQSTSLSSTAPTANQRKQRPLTSNKCPLYSIQRPEIDTCSCATNTRSRCAAAPGRRNGGSPPADSSLGRCRSAAAAAPSPPLPPTRQSVEESIPSLVGGKHPTTVPQYWNRPARAPAATSRGANQAAGIHTTTVHNVGLNGVSGWSHSRPIATRAGGGLKATLMGIEPSLDVDASFCI